MVEDYSKYNGKGTDLRKVQLRLLEMMVEFDRICRKHKLQYFISGGTCLGAVRHGGFIPWDDDVDIDILFKDYTKLKKVLIKELPPNYMIQDPETDKGYYQVFSRIVDLRSTIYYPSETSHFRENLNFKGLFLDIFPIKRIFSYRFKKLVDYYFISLFRYNRGIGRKTMSSPIKRIIFYALWPFAKIIVQGLNHFSFLNVLNFTNKEKYSHIYGTNIVPRIKYSNVFPSKPLFFEGHQFSGPAKPDEYLRDLYGDYMTIPSVENRKTHSIKIEVY